MTAQLSCPLQTKRTRNAIYTMLKQYLLLQHSLQLMRNFRKVSQGRSKLNTAKQSQYDLRIQSKEGKGTKY